MDSHTKKIFKNMYFFVLFCVSAWEAQQTFRYHSRVSRFTTVKRDTFKVIWNQSSKNKHWKISSLNC